MMASSKFAKLAAEVRSKRLAEWITTHNPTVAARAQAKRAAHAGVKRALKSRGRKKTS